MSQTVIALLERVVTSELNEGGWNLDGHRVAATWYTYTVIDALSTWFTYSTETGSLGNLYWNARAASSLYSEVQKADSGLTAAKNADQGLQTRLSDLEEKLRDRDEKIEELSKELHGSRTSAVKLKRLIAGASCVAVIVGAVIGAIAVKDTGLLVTAALASITAVVTVVLSIVANFLYYRFMELRKSKVE
jgi:Flp pilus assembly protein TadB